MAKTIAELDELIAVTVAEREKATKSFDNKIEQYNRMITKLIRDQLNEQPSWEFLLEASRRNMDAYRHLQKLLPEGIIVSGWFPEVGQSGLQLYLKKLNDDDMQELIDLWKFLGDILPSYRGPHIGILRHDAGEEGNWVLKRAGDEWCVVNIRKRGKDKDVPEFQCSLLPCLIHISRNHWGQK